jgi:N utilization substance protein B
MAKANSSRRAGREVALRVLYTVDIGKQPVEEVLNETIAANDERLDDRTTEFARSLVVGTLRARAEIDTELDRVAVGFPTVRQTAVDRNILRLAAAEILFHVSDAPPGAVVNEAVELAKKYSTNESGRFVNGVLGALVREVEQRQTRPANPLQPDIV